MLRYYKITLTQEQWRKAWVVVGEQSRNVITSHVTSGTLSIVLPAGDVYRIGNIESMTRLIAEQVVEQEQ